MEGGIDCGSRDEMVKPSKEIKTASTPGPSDASLESIAVREELGIQVMVEICQVLEWIGIHLNRP